MTTEPINPSDTKPDKHFRPRILSREPKNPKALVFDPLKPNVVTEEEVNEHNKETNKFEVQLPRWRNRVHIYEDDPEKKMGYIFTLRIDRIGFIKNCQRRLGNNYQVLYVKGDKSSR